MLPAMVGPESHGKLLLRHEALKLVFPAASDPDKNI